MGLHNMMTVVLWFIMLLYELPSHSSYPYLHFQTEAYSNANLQHKHKYTVLGHIISH